MKVAPTTSDLLNFLVLFFSYLSLSFYLSLPFSLSIYLPLSSSHFRNKTTFPERLFTQTKNKNIFVSSLIFSQSWFLGFPFFSIPAKKIDRFNDYSNKWPGPDPMQEIFSVILLYTRI